MERIEKGKTADGVGGFSSEDREMNKFSIAPKTKAVNYDAARLAAQAGRLAAFYERKAVVHRRVEAALLALIRGGMS